MKFMERMMFADWRFPTPTKFARHATEQRRLWVRGTLSGLAIAGMLVAIDAPADTDLPTKFSNIGSIVNTRHNLTQGPIGAGRTNMGPYRNDYGEVCVYCHTPHGAGLTSQAPLWNRTKTSATYTKYNTLMTTSLQGTVTDPGPRSLTCLSCHDGTVAIDSIINMPGSGPNTYNAGQELAQNNAFLNTWTNASGPDAGSHFKLADPGCLTCHAEGAVLGSGATSLKVQSIGTDLRDDHPIGVPFNTTADFSTMDGTQGGIKYFERNANGRADSNEIRAYDSGNGYEVECASCHDPHGVPSAGPGSAIFGTFLRVSNSSSGVCLTCHIK